MAKNTKAKARQAGSAGGKALQPANRFFTSNTLACQDVLRSFRTALLERRPWPMALLEAIGRWSIPREEIEREQYHYLLLGEAFDWVALAGRLLSEVDGLVPIEEREALFFHGRLPQEFSEAEFRRLLGPEKYRAHLNYFYGVMVEESLLLAVEEEIRKEQISHGLPDSDDVTQIAYRRIYGNSQEALMKAFFEETGRLPSSSISLTELKEFTYWLSKRRIRSSDSARVASDTKKGLEQLLRLKYISY